jgi:hypothetical protein
LARIIGWKESLVYILYNVIPCADEALCRVLPKIIYFRLCDATLTGYLGNYFYKGKDYNIYPSCIAVFVDTNHEDLEIFLDWERLGRANLDFLGR